MSSTYKTTLLGLNQFIGSDKPKMEDFNFDNQTIEQKFKEHVESNLHLSESERQALQAPPYIMGTYTGNGNLTQKINLPQEVDFGIAFAYNKPLIEAVDSGKSSIWCAIFTSETHSKGAVADTGGFVVQNMNGMPSDGKKCSLNTMGVTYGYVVFPKKAK